MLKLCGISKKIKNNNKNATDMTYFYDLSYFEVQKLQSNNIVYYGGKTK